MVGPVRGVIVPLATPFREGRVDLAGMAWLVEELARRGVDGFFVGSTTGEYTRLTEREVLAAASVVLEYSRDALVLVGVSSDSTERSVSLARSARDLGVDGVVATAPFFLRPPDSGLVRHFVDIAVKSELQLVVYNIPSAVGYEVPPDVVARAALESGGLVSAIKVTSYDMSYPRRLAAALERHGVPRFSVLAGLDDLLLPYLALGGDGGILGLSNVVPEVHVSLFKAWERGDYRAALEAHRKLVLLSSLYDLTPSIPCSVKAALRARGAPIDAYCRPPDGRVPSNTVEEASRILARAGVEPWASPAS